MLSLNSNLSSKLTVKNIIIGQILLFNMKPDSLFYNISKKSKFFKRIYPYYNIYIRNIKFLFKSSQFNEDLKILKIFKKKGFYVDIGCYHPVRYNNTYRMFKLGWKGMNIDLNPLSIALFNVARPTDLNICTAVSNKKVGNLYFDHELSPQNTLEKNYAVFYEKAFGHKIKKLKKIKTRKLSEIFHKNRIYKVDFLNIDAEGHELNILKSINLKKFDIKVICVEVLKHNLKAIIESKKVMRHLNKNGFKFKFRVGINSIFIR